MNINKPEKKKRVFLSIIYHKLQRIFFFATVTNWNKPLIWALNSFAPKIEKTMSKLL